MNHDDAPAHDPAQYGDRIAGVYDSMYPEEGEVEPAADLLDDLCDGGPVLELGVGTGRLAIPLARRGVEIAGVDASEAMVARMRDKPGGRDIPVRIGDFSTMPLGGPYSLVFVAFNTFFALPSQETQVRCMDNVAGALRPGGRFVVEAFVPDLGRFDRGQTVRVTRIEAEEILLDVGRHDPVAQQVRSAHLVISNDAIRTYPVRVRYAWPAELDLMARLAGLELEARWGSWSREPFTASSSSHVSVWRRGGETV